MKSGFVKGETYYVKIKDDTVDLIFDHYSDSTGLWGSKGLWFHDISGRRCYLFELNEINIYRFSDAENYVYRFSLLKRLIETFQW